MPEYHTLRAILGVLEFSIAWGILKWRIGYVFSFAGYMYISAALNIAPAVPSNDSYKWCVQVPAFLLLVIMTVFASLELFAFLYRRTFPQERALLIQAAMVLGLVPVAAGWIWSPENRYQALMLIRQYSLIGIAAGSASAWYWVRHARPVRMAPQIRAHGLLWCAWIASTAILSTSTKGGLLWLVVRWEGGAAAWRYFSDGVMLLQVALCVAFLVNLRRWRSPAPAQSE